jgi:asparagine synthase (glutamine-hydrolysing)
MIYKLNECMLEVWRYWDLPTSLNVPSSKADLITELECLLESAIRQQLVADVPVGIMLSGGIDSSLITALACRQSSKVRTFSITFPSNRSNDESRFSKLVASHFNTEHTELPAEETSAEILPMLARQFDEPMVDSSMIPTWLVSKLVRQHCTVALGGDGGDELFGGYTHYRQLASFNRMQALIPRSIRMAIGTFADNWLPTGQRGRRFLQTLATGTGQAFPAMNKFFDINDRRRLLPSHREQDDYVLQRCDKMLARIGPSPGIVDRATRMDFYSYLPEDILVKIDRASMLNSLEVRSPFLDFRLIEFAFSKVPAEYKVTHSRSKILLKALAERLLPKDLELERKQGFSIPLSAWLKRGAFRTLFWDTLTDPSCIFEQSFVRQLLNGQDKGHSNSERLFALVLLELWRNEYQTYL